MDNTSNGINVVREYIQEKRYLGREREEILEIGGGRTEVVPKEECVTLQRIPLELLGGQ